MEKIDKMHQWLINEKASNRHSFSFLGELIGYSDVGFSKALRGKRLAYEQVLIIADKLNKKDDFLDYISNKTEKSNLIKQKEDLDVFDLRKSILDIKDETLLLDLGLKFIQNYDKLKHIKVVEMFMENQLLKSKK